MLRSPWLAVAFCALFVSSAAAQSSSESAPDTAVTFLRETVVTGARYPRAYFESPQALSFVSRRRLVEMAPIALGDVLGALPGVDNSKDSPWEQRPVLRGLSGQRVLVLVDGSPMNSARGNGPHPSLVDPSQVQRIEVVRGPSSVAYGSDALGGVINIITRDGLRADSQRIGGQVTLGGSTAEKQRNVAVEISPRFGKLSTFLSVGARRADDFSTPDREVPNSAFEDYNGLFNLRYDFTGNTALKAGYQLYRGNDIGIPGLSFEFPGASQDFSFNYYDRDYAHLTLEHTYPGSWLEKTWIKSYWQRESRNFYSDQDFASYLFAAFGVPPSSASGVSSAVTHRDRLFDLNTYGFQAQFTTQKTDLHLFSAGVDAVRDVTDGDNVTRRTYLDASGNAVDGSIDVSASIPDGRFDNYGSYFQSEWYVHPRWTLSAGGRYTHYRYRTDFGVNLPGVGSSLPLFFEPKSLDDDALSGSAGAVFEAAKDVHLTANVATGYRQPNAQDLFFSGPASVGFVFGNDDLKAERSVSYDLGLRWGPGNLAFSGNVFYSTFDDLIDAIAVAPGAYQYVNISKARIWGGEAEAEWQFHPSLSARGAVSGAIGDITSREANLALFAADTDAAPLPNVPPFKGTLALRWRDASRRFWVEPSTRFSWRTNRLPLPTPGVPQLTEFKKEWIVADLFAGAQLPSGQRLVLGIRNITDTPYRQALASVEDPGISFVGSLSTDF